jgi:hypothetical protein
MLALENFIWQMLGFGVFVSVSPSKVSAKICLQALLNYCCYASK